MAATLKATAILLFLGLLSYSPGVWPENRKARALWIRATELGFIVLHTAIFSVTIVVYTYYAISQRTSLKKWWLLIFGHLGLREVEQIRIVNEAVMIKNMVSVLHSPVLAPRSTTGQWPPQRTWIRKFLSAFLYHQMSPMQYRSRFQDGIMSLTVKKATRMSWIGCETDIHVSLSIQI